MSQEDSKVHFFPNFAMSFSFHNGFYMYRSSTHDIGCFQHPAAVCSVCWRYLNRNPMDHPPLEPSAGAVSILWCWSVGAPRWFSVARWLGTNSGLAVLQILFAVFVHVPSCFGWLSHLTQPVFICFWGVDTTNQMVFFCPGNGRFPFHSRGSTLGWINRGAGLTSNDLCVGWLVPFHTSQGMCEDIVTFWPSKSSNSCFLWQWCAANIFVLANFHRNQPQQWSGCDKPQRLQ